MLIFLNFIRKNLSKIKSNSKKILRKRKNNKLLSLSQIESVFLFLHHIICEKSI